MHDPRHQVSPKLLNFHEKKRERERERKKRQSVSFMKTDTGCRYSPRHLIISVRNIVEFPNFSNSLRPSLPEFARGSPLLLLFLLSTIHENDRHNAIEQKKKVSIENNSRTSNKNFRTVSNFIIHHDFSVLSFLLSFSPHDCFAGENFQRFHLLSR